jgi:hypothetical protein
MLLTGSTALAVENEAMRRRIAELEAALVALIDAVDAKDAKRIEDAIFVGKGLTF